MKHLLLSAFSLWSLAVLAQTPSFTVTVSNDSVLLGNVTVVRFELENVRGSNFQFPTFSGFHVNGPNVSTQTTIINGTVNQRTTYTYYLEPLDVGEYYIEPASVETEEGFLETQAIPIQVYPNPDGIIQDNPLSRQGEMFFQFGMPAPGDGPGLRSPFGEEPFGRDFFDNSFFEDFFQRMPGLPMPRLPQADSLGVQPKKRKTTRL
ncbi:MAG: hypothetical protein D6772_05270 [Bacteroidetes bacterium]|nr:MAG: hypothetical protein D6772_05270 [Bacteroidota bacterium]